MRRTAFVIAALTLGAVGCNHPAPSRGECVGVLHGREVRIPLDGNASSFRDAFDERGYFVEANVRYRSDRVVVHAAIGITGLLSWTSWIEGLAVAPRETEVGTLYDERQRGRFVLARGSDELVCTYDVRAATFHGGSGIVGTGGTGGGSYGTYDDGSYDDGSYDDGSYDDGSYDDGSYDDGSYDDGSYDDGSDDDGSYDDSDDYYDEDASVDDSTDADYDESDSSDDDWW